MQRRIRRTPQADLQLRSDHSITMSLTLSPEQYLAQSDAPLLTIVAEDPAVDFAQATAAVSDLLTALGRDVTNAHLADTPRRVAASLLEMLTPRDFTMTTFPNDEGYEELVLVRDIPFHSLCEHHMLPFRGVAHVGYIPGERILGISKLARVVEKFASDLQVQERLTKQVADYLQEHLDARAVGVVLEAEHLCMSLRGVQSVGATTITSTFLGDLVNDATLRNRFFASGSRVFTAPHIA